MFYFITKAVWGRGKRRRRTREGGRREHKRGPKVFNQRRKNDVPGHLYSQPEGSTAGFMLEHQHISCVNLRDTMLNEKGDLEMKHVTGHGNTSL